MSQPTAYDPTTDFSQEEAANAAGRAPVDTAKLDAEFSALALTVAQVLTVIALNQRDDGEIRDGRVKIHTLATDVLALITAAGANVRGAWLTTTSYAVADVVVESDSTYICATAHTSGTFATDLAAVKWVLIANAPSAFAAASVSFTPTGGIAAANVQAAVAELDGEALKKASNLSDVTTPATALANLGALPTAGGTMTGNLTLNGNPSSDLYAAPKQYVDGIIDGLNCGQCRFAVTSTTQAKLSPLNGNKLFINGEWFTIPAAGVTISNSGISVSTTYYVYCYSSGGTLTLELSTTAYATDSTYGNVIKNGDATRVLVGMLRAQSGSTIFETGENLYLSWFNRRARTRATNFSTDRSTTATSAAEINSEIRNAFLCWSGDVVALKATGTVSGSGGTVRMFVGVDGTSTRTNGGAMAGTDFVPVACMEDATGLSEGYHYATLIGWVSAGTGTWKNGSGLGCAVTATVQG